MTVEQTYIKEGANAARLQHRNRNLTALKAIQPIATEYLGDLQEFKPAPESESAISPIGTSDCKSRATKQT